MSFLTNQKRIQKIAKQAGAELGKLKLNIQLLRKSQGTMEKVSRKPQESIDKVVNDGVVKVLKMCQESIKKFLRK